ncbi:hypothetical protein ACHQM5_006065 [Ranunculus cassubicifolius]
MILQVGGNPEEVIQLPSGINTCNNIKDLIFAVYPKLNIEGTATNTYLNERTILSARNDDVSTLNEEMLQLFPGEVEEFLSADKIVEDENDRDGRRYPTELLNSQNHSSMPPFKLKIKKGCPVMLLRNIAPKDGLCNGTRLKVLRCGGRVIEAQILTGSKAGNEVLIPRMTITPTTKELPFKMSRRQFPIRLAFAMTINKSQGQSVRYVGIDLRTPVFSHGQLYVALSRCTSSKRISVILPPEHTNNTNNVVYPEVLL